MTERIYIKAEGGGVTPVDEEPFSLEDDLQALIAENPDLLAGEQVSPDAPRRWMLVAREKGIAETADAGHNLAVDLLIVDQGATPTLVEVKRGANREIRRAVIGQMLEYAAHAAHTWTETELRQTFEEYARSRGRDPNEELAKLLGPESNADADGFWERVATNLEAKNMRLLFVADDIPDQLERVVEFLNAQMQRIEVLAVEIKQFRKDSVQALVPRVMGRIAAASTRSTSKLNRQTFLDLFSGASRNEMAQLLDYSSQELGCTLVYGTQTISIRMSCSKWPPMRTITLAYLYLPSGGTYYTDRGIEFTVALNPEPSYPPELTAILDEWLGQFSGDRFPKNVSTPKYNSWAFTYKDVFDQKDQMGLLKSRLQEIVGKLKD